MGGVETFLAMVHRMNISPRGAQLVNLLRTLPPEPMVRSTKTRIWHAGPTCAAATGPLEEVALTLWSLPEQQQYCTGCTSARAFPVGKMLTVFADATAVFDTPLHWAGIQERRRFAIDPLRSCKVRAASPTWDEIRRLLEPHLEAELAAAARAAAELSRSPLHTALLAAAVLGDEPAPQYADRLELQHLAGLNLHIPRSHMVHRQLADLREAGMATVFCVSPHAARLADGSDLERVVDLAMFATNEHVDAYSAVFEMPRAALHLFESATTFTAVQVPSPEPALATLAWASTLYRTAPQRGLAAALSAATRLTVAR